jgi:hypothetical protein
MAEKIDATWLPVVGRDTTPETEIYKYPDNTSIHATVIKDSNDGSVIAYQVGDRSVGTGWVNDRDISSGDERRFGPFRFRSTSWERIALFPSPQKAAAWLASRGVGPAAVRGFCDADFETETKD